MTVPQDLSAPTGQTQWLQGAIYAADASTQLTASSAASLVSAAPNSDPPLVVATDVYQSRIPDGTGGYPAQEKVLLFRAGQTIKTSVWNAAFPKATIASITPATGAHGSTTPVTVTGTGFTPGTTLHVGGNAVTSVTVQSPTQLTCTVPTASGAGAADVTITNDGGTFDAGNLFTYT